MQCPLTEGERDGERGGGHSLISLAKVHMETAGSASLWWETRFFVKLSNVITSNSAGVLLLEKPTDLPEDSNRSHFDQTFCPGWSSGASICS